LRYRASRYLSAKFVMAGLDPAIHAYAGSLAARMVRKP
jgi:hypothetical protein